MSNRGNIDVGDEFLADALGEGQEHQERERDEFTAPPVQPPQRGGYAPLIEQKRKEIRDLEAKMANHRETGAYMVQGHSGQSDYFDHIAFQEDNAHVNKLSREIGELREREARARDELNNRNRAAAEMARAVVNSDLPRVPENIRAATKEGFAAMFRALTESGEWGKTVYADRENLRRGLMQMMDAAVGQAMRKGEFSGVVPSGGPEGVPPKPPVEDEEDDFTNNLMYAFERRRRGSMTFAEAKAARAAETGGKSE